MGQRPEELGLECLELTGDERFTDPSTSLSRHQ
jgi:hypothetical protein